MRRLERRRARRAVRWLDLDIDVTGVEHVDPSGQYVVAPLHEGFADVLALLALPLGLTFVGRNELTDWRPLGRMLQQGRHVAVRPEAGALAYRRLLRASPEIVARGESLVVFPQGSILGVEAAFAPGAFRLAARLGLPVLPIVLTGSHRVWEYPFRPVVRFGERMRMHILPAVPASDAIAARRRLERRMKRIALASPVPPRRFDPDRDGWWDGYRFSIDPDFPELAARFAQRSPLAAPANDAA